MAAQSTTVGTEESVADSVLGSAPGHVLFRRLPLTLLELPLPGAPDSRLASVPTIISRGGPIAIPSVVCL